MKQWARKGLFIFDSCAVTEILQVLACLVSWVRQQMQVRMLQSHLRDFPRNDIMTLVEGAGLAHQLRIGRRPDQAS